MITDTSMRNQIIATLDGHPCDIDEVCDVMRTSFGLVDINTIPADDYWRAMAVILAEDISCPLPKAPSITKDDVLKHCRQYGMSSIDTNGAARHLERSDVEWTSAAEVVRSYYAGARHRA
jgi:hypothetical protein